MVVDLNILITCVLVFFARIVDVSVGTIRIISIVQGRIKTAFVLGFIEVSIWLLVISTVMEKLKESPIIAIFYALGYASGNVAGIMIEKRFAIGNALLRIIFFDKGRMVADELRRMGYQVMIFEGIDGDRAVQEIEVPCRRIDIEEIVKLARSHEKEVYFVTESIGLAPRLKLPTMQQSTGWRGIFKRK
ncbi:MAG TPA: DUF5698 domain-containing protein [Candidatus Rifleibacterium sp.]|nr:DUF5698 domain-containing protein [Candidatus Rifleibacterium sp.]HPT47000.1 DUF5698 domain-containing protein [Candidatus Rifleibacterium sp.]